MTDFFFFLFCETDEIVKYLKGKYCLELLLKRFLLVRGKDVAKCRLCYDFGHFVFGSSRK